MKEGEMKQINYEKLKENLVENLRDIATIKAYLHRKKYTVFDLLKEGLKPFKHDRKLQVKFILYSISAGLIPILDAFILYFLVDRISKGRADMAYIIKISGIFALSYIGLNVISSQIKYRLELTFFRVRLDMLHTCLNKIMTMDYGLLENPDFINEQDRYMYGFSSNNTGIEGVYHRLFELGGKLVSFIALGLIICYLSVFIFIFSIFSIIVYVLIKEKIATFKHQRIEKLNLYARRSKRLTELASDFKYGKDLRIYDFMAKLKEKMKESLNNYIAYYKYCTREELIFAFFLAMALVLVEALGLHYLALSLIAKNVSLAQISLLVSSLLLFMAKLEEVSQAIGFIRDQIKYFADGLDMMKADLNSLTGKKTLDDDKNLEIAFEDVSFSYPGDDKKIFEHLTFKIEKGQRLALVGVNGAGKTSLVKLMLGLYKPSSGKIYLNGIDSEAIDIIDRFKAFSVVLQETEPFALSIGENVAASSDAIDRNRVYQSLVDAGLKEKIDLLPKGIDTQMTKIIDEEGTIFSGGENQKLAIARALYKKDYKALILDEPTASLDALAEEKIYKDLDKIVKDKTLIFVSHRLASSRFCDKIALLDGGNIVEYGSNEELMEKDGLYKKMFMAQGKYYKE